MSQSVRINELHLRAPGLTQDQGRKLGDAVAQRLLKLNVGRSRTLSSLKVSVPSGTSASVAHLADEIVASINGKLR